MTLSLWPLRRSAAGIALCLAVVMGLTGAPSSKAQPAIPDPLVPWVPWVLHEHPELPCPLVQGQRLCAWPGRLTLDLNDRGGSFVLQVQVDREMDLALPGSSVDWPRQVESQGRPAFMRRLDPGPGIRLGPGRHRISGSYEWSRLPESLPVPPTVAMIDLTVAGSAVTFPRRDADGRLWLASSRDDEETQERLNLEVERRVEDGVPVTLTTRLVLRVSGRARTVELASPLLPGFVLTGLGGELPVRWIDGDSLRVQVRPGTWEIRLRARSTAPVGELDLVPRPTPWPEQELWAFLDAPAVRAVRRSGAPTIDPQRTSLPADWKNLSVYQVAAGTTFRLDEVRRGVAEVPPDALRLSRIWWLEQRGDRFTVQDTLTGELYQGGRLQASAPARLGRLELAGDGEGRDQVLTLDPDPEGDDAPSGVEVRSGDLAATAELTYDRGGALPAVGWNRDVQNLQAELRVPPGFTLLAAPGSDRARGSWMDRWNLLDLFLLLILTLATWRLDDKRWGLVAFLFLGLSWHEPRALGLWIWWLALLPLRALLRVLPEEGRGARVVRRMRWTVLLLFAVQLLIFCGHQWRTGLFPVLEGGPGSRGRWTDSVARMPAAVMADEAPAILPPAEAEPPVPQAPPVQSSTYRSRQVDVNAVVQTGPGVPNWQWRSYTLEWDGPVTAEHRLRLWLVSPAWELVLSLLRIAGAVVVGWLLLHPRHTAGAVGGAPTPGGGGAGGGEQGTSAATAAAALVTVLVLGAGSWAEGQPPPVPESPPSRVLTELERRLTAPPPCHPHCIEVPRLELRAGPGGVRILADVHAAAASAWPLPGPAATWTPARVTVDGQPATALRLAQDGFFLLRLETGIHQVELRGPARDSLALELPLRPRTLQWQGDGWTLDGWRPDDPPPGALRLDRQLPQAELAGGGTDVEPEPWLELVRELDMGIPWLVHNRLRRRGAAGSPVLVRVPLLSGESITTADIAVEGGEAILDLEAGETVRHFDSTLAEADQVTLTAPEGRPWLETWELVCSPVWNCRAQGLTPTGHMRDGTWRPRWQPWPGETVTIHLVRPKGAPGQTTTVDSAELRLEPGQRLLEATLELTVRTSRGGEQALGLPPEARLQSFEIDEVDHPVQADDGRVRFTLDPGTHHLRAHWRQEHRPTPLERMPAVSVGGEAVNVNVQVEVPQNRWLLWAGGPGWGPVVQFWQYLLVLVLASLVLGRWAPTPLKVHDWLLLGAGLTQVPFIFALFIAAWLVLLGMRHPPFAAVSQPGAAGDPGLPPVRTGLEPRRWWSYDLLQLLLGVLGLIALGSLYAAIHAGLLFQPDMQVLGPGSYGASLNWYVDRTPGTLPQPWLLWLPLWVWRLLMLLWSLWLAARLLRWLPWCWQRLTPGPLLAGPTSFQRWLERGGTA